MKFESLVISNSEIDIQKDKQLDLIKEIKDLMDQVSHKFVKEIGIETKHMNLDKLPEEEFKQYFHAIASWITRDDVDVGKIKFVSETVVYEGISAIQVISKICKDEKSSNSTFSLKERRILFDFYRQLPEKEKKG